MRTDTIYASLLSITECVKMSFTNLYVPLRNFTHLYVPLRNALRYYLPIFTHLYGMCKDNDIIKRRSFTLVSGMRKALLMHLYAFLWNTLSYRWRWVIDQLWGRDGWILAKFFFCVFMDRDGVEVHNLAKENEAIIQPSWPNKPGQ